MKILIVGYGSIGVRHEKVALDLGHEVFIVSRRKNITKNSYQLIDEALNDKKFDLILIANETSLHEQTLDHIQTLNFDGKVLVEKPLFSGKNNNKVSHPEDIYVGYNLRFHPIISKIKDLLKDEKILTATFQVGNYLPNWRENRNYSKSYSASKELGGGVLRDLSHELDLSLFLLDKWIALTATGGKASNLQITSDDNFSILLKTINCDNVQIHLNYLNKIAKRQIVINTENFTLDADLIKNTLTLNEETESFKVVYNESYEKQLLGIINNTGTVCTYDEGLSIVNMIQKIEYASDNLCWVNNT